MKVLAVVKLKKSLTNSVAAFDLFVSGSLLFLLYLTAIFKAIINSSC